MMLLDELIQMIPILGTAPKSMTLFFIRILIHIVIRIKISGQFFMINSCVYGFLRHGTASGLPYRRHRSMIVQNLHIVHGSSPL